MAANYADLEDAELFDPELSSQSSDGFKDPDFQLDPEEIESENDDNSNPSGGHKPTAIKDECHRKLVISLVLENKVGALLKALRVYEEHILNITSISSSPFNEWEQSNFMTDPAPTPAYLKVATMVDVPPATDMPAVHQKLELVALNPEIGEDMMAMGDRDFGNKQYFPTVDTVGMEVIETGWTAQSVRERSNCSEILPGANSSYTVVATGGSDLENKVGVNLSDDVNELENCVTDSQPKAHHSQEALEFTGFPLERVFPEPLNDYFRLFNGYHNEQEAGRFVKMVPEQEPEMPFPARSRTVHRHGHSGHLRNEPGFQRNGIAADSGFPEPPKRGRRRGRPRGNSRALTSVNDRQLPHGRRTLGSGDRRGAGRGSVKRRSFWDELLSDHVEETSLGQKAGVIEGDRRVVREVGGLVANMVTAVVRMEEKKSLNEQLIRNRWMSSYYLCLQSRLLPCQSSSRANRSHGLLPAERPHNHSAMTSVFRNCAEFDYYQSKDLCSQLTQSQMNCGPTPIGSLSHLDLKASSIAGNSCHHVLSNIHDREDLFDDENMTGINLGNSCEASEITEEFWEEEPDLETVIEVLSSAIDAVVAGCDDEVLAEFRLMDGLLDCSEDAASLHRAVSGSRELFKEPKPSVFPGSIGDSRFPSIPRRQKLLMNKLSVSLETPPTIINNVAPGRRCTRSAVKAAIPVPPGADPDLWTASESLVVSLADTFEDDLPYLFDSSPEPLDRTDGFGRISPYSKRRRKKSSFRHRRKRSSSGSGFQKRGNRLGRPPKLRRTDDDLLAHDSAVNIKPNHLLCDISSYSNNSATRTRPRRLDRERDPILEELSRLPGVVVKESLEMVEQTVSDLLDDLVASVLKAESAKPKTWESLMTKAAKQRANRSFPGKKMAYGTSRVSFARGSGPPMKIKCPHCEYVGYKDHVRRHITCRHSSSPPSFLCPECGKGFRRADHLKSHLALHTYSKDPHEFPCPTCSRVFKFRKNLKHHMMSHFVPVVPTSVCDSETGMPDVSGRSDALSQAVLAASSDEYETDEDVSMNGAYEDADGSSTKLLRKKKKRRESGRYLNGSKPVPKKVKCPHCDYIGHPDHVHRHVLCKHSNAPPEYGCDLCGKTFMRSDKLKQHLKTNKHNRPIGGDGTAEYGGAAVVPAQPREKGEFPCEICGKIFEYKDRAERHVKSHETKPKKFSCSYCGKAFGSQANVQGHENAVHLKIREHLCMFCGKLFSQQAGLNGHIQRFHGPGSENREIVPKKPKPPREPRPPKLPKQPKPPKEFNPTPNLPQSIVLTSDLGSDGSEPKAKRPRKSKAKKLPFYDPSAAAADLNQHNGVEDDNTFSFLSDFHSGLLPGFENSGPQPPPNSAISGNNLLVLQSSSSSLLTEACYSQVQSVIDEVILLPPSASDTQRMDSKYKTSSEHPTSVRNQIIGHGNNEEVMSASALMAQDAVDTVMQDLSMLHTSAGTICTPPPGAPLDEHQFMQRHQQQQLQLQQQQQALLTAQEVAFNQQQQLHQQQQQQQQHHLVEYPLHHTQRQQLHSQQTAGSREEYLQHNVQQHQSACSTPVPPSRPASTAHHAGNRHTPHLSGLDGQGTSSNLQGAIIGGSNTGFASSMFGSSPDSPRGSGRSASRASLVGSGQQLQRTAPCSSAGLSPHGSRVVSSSGSARNSNCNGPPGTNAVPPIAPSSNVLELHNMYSPGGSVHPASSVLGNPSLFSAMPGGIGAGINVATLAHLPVAASSGDNGINNISAAALNNQHQRHLAAQVASAAAASQLAAVPVPNHSGNLSVPGHFAAAGISSSVCGAGSGTASGAALDFHPSAIGHPGNPASTIFGTPNFNWMTGGFDFRTMHLAAATHNPAAAAAAQQQQMHMQQQMQQQLQQQQQQQQQHSSQQQQQLASEHQRLQQQQHQQSQHLSGLTGMNFANYHP